MHFETIAITGGATDAADPRSAPADVKDEHLKATPLFLQSTDQPPERVILALEGTAGQDVTVRMHVLAEGVPNQAKADRKFYAVAGAVDVPVGGTVELPAYPGIVYYRVTALPAADARLLISFAAGAPYVAPA